VEGIKELVNAFFSSPSIVFLASVALFALFFIFIKFFTRPIVASVIAGTVVLCFGFAMTDPNFMEVVAKPDNVPIVGMLFILGFFTWLAMRKAVVNDARIAKGEPVIEKTEKDEKVFVWPDLVYTELICMVLLSIVLIVWSIVLQAPLEEPANPSVAPNPSKAPWYFLGLQEMLVYFDPWIAGVFFPVLIIFGLMAIPYLDLNPKGSGYYTLKERPIAIVTFSFGFLILWILLIVFGTFLRGPNWNFFGPFEYWDIHKVESLVNVNLSEFIYVRWLGTALPKFWLTREVFGFLLVILYFAVIPPLLAKTYLRNMYLRMGLFRFNVVMFLMLMMLSLPIKMVLRWAFNLKYIVSIPEYFFNI